ncbi:MAG: YkgJ family cysteine cluster protein, partial [Limnohabitans sp.]
MRSPIAVVDVDRCETWTRYRAGLCNDCAANCCTMPVEVRTADLVRLGWVEAFMVEHVPVRQWARQLEKSGRLERYNARTGLFT